MRADNPGLSIYKYQPPATLNQAAPVIGTLYDILPATADVRVYEIVVNIEDTNETLEVQGIVDGQLIGGIPITATHSANYYIFRASNAITRTDHLAGNTSSTAPNNAFYIEGHSVRIQARKTTAAGVGNLTGIVVYGVKTLV